MTPKKSDKTTCKNWRISYLTERSSLNGATEHAQSVVQWFFIRPDGITGNACCHLYYFYCSRYRYGESTPSQWKTPAIGNVEIARTLCGSVVGVGLNDIDITTQSFNP